MSRLTTRPAVVTVSAAASIVACLSANPGTARAYTIASAISSGCHERITAEALRAVRLELATAAPLAADRNEQALIDDVEFPVPADLGDLGGVALLLGVRDNDPGPGARLRAGLHLRQQLVRGPRTRIRQQ